jgi:ribosomal protein L12E/L44/L45/RPP1/RPP2
MVPVLRRLVILVLGAVLLVAPTLVRDNLWQYNTRSYEPPAVPTLALAATPLPTPTPLALSEAAATRDRELRAGPVLLDLAHSNSINPSMLQPLADALADQGVGLRYWLSTVDPLTVMNYLDYPDQSEALAAELADASALIVISPFFLWSPEEIAVTEQFVANGGRLLLISDPDVLGDYAAVTNMIGEPFGVVFNEDYLYDTATNDGNFTFFFQTAAINETVPVTMSTAMTASLPSLLDRTIAFYGGRSLSGDLQALLHSVDTTLSSLRVGRNRFITAALAGVPERGTAGRVLALSDLDVLTEPYRQRHDNQQLVDYVAAFLSVGQRSNRVVDFPDYLSKQVNLAFGASAAINANLIIQGAEIQHALEASGRTLTLTDSSQLSTTTTLDTASGSGAANDLIYLAAYTTAISQTNLLQQLEIELYREVVTETVPIATPTATATPAAPTDDEAADDETADDASAGDEDEGTAEEEETPVAPPADDDETPEATVEPPLPAPLATLTPSPTLTTTVPVTAALSLRLAQQTPPTATVAAPLTTTTAVTAETTSTVNPAAAISTTAPITSSTPISTSMVTTATPAFEIRTVITEYLRLASGLTFLADETVLVVHNQLADGATLLAVLAANNRGIDEGVNRLLSNDFTGCVIGDVLTFCALEPNGDNAGSASSTTPSDDADTANDAPAPDEEDSEEDEPAPADPTPSSASDRILLIDDNSAAGAAELSEADIYLQLLLAGSYQVDLWSVGDAGDPTVDDLLEYGWVIWSNGGYANGEIDGSDLDTIFSYINGDGRITVSSRMPLPGLEERAPLLDLVTDNSIPAMVAGLPDAPIAISGDDTDAAVLNALAEGDEATQVVLRRGPDSEASEAPVLVVLADPSSGESKARLMIAALNMAWLPSTEQETLITNMASWMLAP